ncbi:MAG: putative rRNA methylase [Firmicutes bacterium]|nr:putative rRNA methylase [Bacillota bacterium]
MKLSNAVKMAHQMLAAPLSRAQCVVDATAGNGHDTLFLAQNTLAATTVFSFDIQQAALDKTKQKIAAHGFTSKVCCILDSHVEIISHLTREIDVAMFNLGYLPGGSKTITTQAKTTVSALQKLLPRLSLGGMVSVVAYPGYPSGEEESMALHHFLQSLSQQEYVASSYAMLNQVNQPPVLYMIEKIGGEAGEGTASCKN